MRMLYNQRKKLHKETLFFGCGKEELKTIKSRLLVSSFSHFTILKFEQQRLLRECIETYYLRCLETVSTTFQGVDFDES